MRNVIGMMEGKRIAAALAAGLLALGGAPVSLAAVAVPTNNTAVPAKPDPDGIVDDGTGGDEGEPPARPAQNGQSTAEPISYDATVAATREGLSRSAIGSGIKRLRLLDYILIGAVGLLLLLVIVLLVLVASLRSRVAALAAGPGARSLAQEEEQLYGSKSLP